MFLRELVNEVVEKYFSTCRKLNSIDFTKLCRVYAMAIGRNPDNVKIVDVLPTIDGIVFIMRIDGEKVSVKLKEMILTIETAVRVVENFLSG